jgi:hypothetical protein
MMAVPAANLPGWRGPSRVDPAPFHLGDPVAAQDDDEVGDGGHGAQHARIDAEVGQAGQHRQADMSGHHADRADEQHPLRAEQPVGHPPLSRLVVTARATSVNG